MRYFPKTNLVLCLPTLSGITCLSEVNKGTSRFLHWLVLVQANVKVKVAQSCLALCYLMDHTAYGILQVRILEWVSFPFSRGSSQPRDRTKVSLSADGFFNTWAISTGQGKHFLSRGAWRKPSLRIMNHFKSNSKHWWDCLSVEMGVWNIQLGCLEGQCLQSLIQ